jgi:hypothetical protein
MSFFHRISKPGTALYRLSSPSFSTAHIAAFRDGPGAEGGGSHRHATGTKRTSAKALADTAPTRGARWPGEGRDGVENSRKETRAILTLKIEEDYAGVSLADASEPALLAPPAAGLPEPSTSRRR